ncbi:MAG: T9SS type A sorting domain-containing protein [Saprospiraceae bacterium]
MKSSIYCIFVLISILCNHTVHSQCPENYYYSAQSQTDVDSFKILYPLCTMLMDLFVVGEETSNLEGFSELVNVENIWLTNTGVSSFTDMKGCIINTSLSISSNKKLQNIDDLNLEIFLITVRDNSLLKNLNLNGLDFLGGVVLESDSMEVFVDDIVINGISAYGNIKFHASANLTVGQSIILDSCVRYNSFSEILNDINIDDISSFSIGNLDSFSTQGIIDIPNLTDFDFRNIDYLETSYLKEVSFDLLRFDLLNINNIVDFHDFESININFLFRIVRLDNLKTLDGIENTVQNIVNLIIVDNPKLEDISVLEHLNDDLPINSFFWIKNNEILEVCNYQPICNLVINNGSNPNLIIQNNSGTCLDEETLKMVCLTDVTDIEFSETEISPNPTFDDVNIEFNQSMAGSIIIYNMSGNVLYKSNFNKRSRFSIDLSTFEAGIYTLKVLSDLGSIRNYKICKI